MLLYLLGMLLMMHRIPLRVMYVGDLLLLPLLLLICEQ
jgi:hypothetical protein